MAKSIDYDIVVVGSGPAGATTARYAAQNGLKVLLIDKKQELGAPVQCSGAVSAHALHDAAVHPDDEFIQKAIFGFKIHDGNGRSSELDYRKLKPEPYKQEPLGYVVDRRRFDRYLMTQAERAGAEVWLKTNALSWKKEPDGTATLQLERLGEKLEINTKVVVGADGLQSQIGKWANLRTHIKLSELASCLQFVCDGVEDLELLEIITGNEWAPGGYAWVFPKGKGYVEVGLGVIRTMTDKDARWHLDHFMNHSSMKDRFKNAKILEIQGGGVPLASPLKKQYDDNVILVGDAARHVNPITGGGIHTALRCGVIAGEFLAEVCQNGENYNAEILKAYQDRWMDKMGSVMWKLYDLKTEIFADNNIEKRDTALFETMSGYFNPESEYRKI